MKILHIQDRFAHLGGAEKYVFDICSALTHAGHGVTVLADKDKIAAPTAWPQQTHWPWPVHGLTPSYGIRSTQHAWQELNALLTQDPPDLIHLHNTHYFISPFILHRLIRRFPVIKTVHDARFYCPHQGRLQRTDETSFCTRPMGWSCWNRQGCYPFHQSQAGLGENFHKFLLMKYELAITAHCDRILAGSHHTIDHLRKNHFPAERLEVLPNYTNMGLGALPLTRSDSSPPILLYVGLLSREKGAWAFLELLTLLTSPWQAVIVGEGPLLAEIQQEIQHRQWTNQIRMYNRMASEQLAEIYQSATLLVMPSLLPETFGMVGIEAMAWARPVVAFDAGGVREWLTSGQTGWLVPMGDVSALAQRVQELLDHPEHAQAMGQAGQKHVEQRFRPHHHLTRLLEIYQEVRHARSVSTRQGHFRLGS